MRKTEIHGDKKLMRKLKELPKRVQTKVNRRAVNLATTIIVRAAKSEAPVDKGNLRRAITKKMYNRNMLANGIVGADANFIAEGGEAPVFYDHLVEYGHVAPDGTKVPANPFLQRAWDGSISAARRRYEQVLAEGIEKEASKR